MSSFQHRYLRNSRRVAVVFSIAFVMIWIAFASALRLLATPKHGGANSAAAPDSCSLPNNPGIALRCIPFEDHIYAVADIDLRVHKIIFTASRQHKMQSYPSAVADLSSAGHQPILMTNAGIYGTDNRPLGLLITPQGKEHEVSRAASKNGNFSWDSAVFAIRADDTAAILSARDWRADPGTVAATQSGPQLAASAKLNPDIPQRSASNYLRTAVGVDQSSAHIVHIAVSRDSVTLFELASFMVDRAHCSEALHLDGSLSAFYLPKAKDKFIFSDPGERIVTVLSVLRK
jgi:uncharacterized protein YigE (DUF2233 family)